jgi:hypothetical protein
LNAPERDKVSFTLNNQIFPESKPTIRHEKNKHVAFLWLIPDGEDTEGPKSNETCKQIQAGLEDLHLTSRHIYEECKIESNGEDIIQSLKKNNSHINLVLAVTSAALGRGTKSKPIHTRLRQLAERNQGLSIICASETSLQKMIEEQIWGGRSVLPPSLKRRINLMLGRANYDTHVLTPNLKEKLGQTMVVGAHICHKSTGTHYTPSVASIVASIDESILQFAGSASFQRTTGVIRSTDEQDQTVSSKRVPQDSISEFVSMMVERFRAWRNQNEPPRSIIVFRDSMSHHDDNLVDLEYKLIHHAYKLHFESSKTLPLVAYIVVSKNIGLNYNNMNSGDASRTTTKSTDGVLQGIYSIEHPIAKYHFYIYKNELQLSLDELQDLVSYHKPPLLLCQYSPTTPDPQSQRQQPAPPTTQPSQ